MQSNDWLTTIQINQGHILQNDKTLSRTQIDVGVSSCYFRGWLWVSPVYDIKAVRSGSMASTQGCNAWLAKIQRQRRCFSFTFAKHILLPFPTHPQSSGCSVNIGLTNRISRVVTCREWRNGGKETATGTNAPSRPFTEGAVDAVDGWIRFYGCANFLSRLEEGEANDADREFRLA